MKSEAVRFIKFCRGEEVRNRKIFNAILIDDVMGTMVREDTHHCFV